MTDNEPPDYTLPGDLPVVDEDPTFWVVIQVHPDNKNVLHMDLVKDAEIETILNEVNVPPGSQANVQLPPGHVLIMGRGEKFEKPSPVLRPAGMTGGLILPGR
jgi:hypothetical protein